MKVRLLLAALLFGPIFLSAQSSIDSLAKSTPAKKTLGSRFRNLGDAIANTKQEFSLSAMLKLAEQYEKNLNYQKATEQYSKAVIFCEDKGFLDRANELREKVGELYEKQGKYNDAVRTYGELHRYYNREGDVAKANAMKSKMDLIEGKTENTATDISNLRESLLDSATIAADKEMEQKEKEASLTFESAEKAESSQDYMTALKFYKEYATMVEGLAEEKRLQELSLLEQSHQIENQDREIKLLKQSEEIGSLTLKKNQAELNKQIAFKRSLGVGLGLIGLLAASLFFLYRNKKRDHRKLGVAYDDLATANTKLEEAETRIKDLLGEQVSVPVADALMAGTNEGEGVRKFVCIMFLDIRDFTPFAEKLAPEELIDYQNKVLGFMMEIVTKRKGIVNQVLGDGFMATFGAPVSAGNDCLEAYLAAQEIIREVKERSESEEIPATRIGIGLHAGHVVTGNVGAEGRKQFSITGNPVIIAARLEKLNKDFGSSLVYTEEVFEKLPAELQPESESKTIQVKGRNQPVTVRWM